MSEYQKHINIGVLKNYLDNKLAKAEARKVEEHLLNCELCSDALEGMQLAGADHVLNAKKEIDQLIRKKSEKTVPWMKVAASIVLVLSFGFLFYFLNNDKSENLSQKLDIQTMAPEESKPVQERAITGETESQPEKQSVEKTEETVQESSKPQEIQTEVAEEENMDPIVEPKLEISKEEGKTAYTAPMPVIDSSIYRLLHAFACCICSSTDRG
jgi:hypothetical protein